jgi:hypothetical protein
MGGSMETRGDDQYTRVLGAAVIKAWGRLPSEVQQILFEEAVVAGHAGAAGRAGAYDDSLREQLAIFLHDRHPRTQDASPS